MQYALYIHTYMKEGDISYSRVIDTLKFDRFIVAVCKYGVSNELLSQSVDVGWKLSYCRRLLMTPDT